MTTGPLTMDDRAPEPGSERGPERGADREREGALLDPFAPGGPYGPAQAAAEPVAVRWWRTVDKWLLGAVGLLVLLGLVLGLAASPPLARDNGLPEFHYVQRQAFFTALGLIVMVAVSMAPLQWVRRAGVVGFALGLGALALLPALGTDFGKGAVRWYSLGFTSLQPSEFVKPCFALFSGWLLAGALDRNGPPGKLLSFFAAGVVAALLVIQPDFGQATLVLAMWGVMYFVAGASMPLIAGLVGAVAAGGVAAYHSSEHFARRIDGYLNAEVDPRTQLGYATQAIQEGGFFGVGVGEGSVKNTLPDAHTDFIIAVAAEEFGLLMVLLIIGLFLFLTLRALWRLSAERDPFARLAGAGLAALFGLQAFVNLGVAVRLLPAKGMTLPFISYGGSSMLAAGIAMGALLAITRRRPQTDVTEAFGSGR